MKKAGILNSDISRVLSYMGHTDLICVGDCGLPIPDEVERIDLALKFGVPTFMETLETVTINDNLDSYVKLDRIKNASKAVSMNEAGIDNLAVETMQVAKLTNDYLNKIIDIMDNTKNYYKCEAGDALRANL